MARRKKAGDDFIGMIGQLAGLAILIGLIYPPFRQAINSFGFVFILLLVVALVAVVGIRVYKCRSARVAEPGHFSFETQANSASVSPTMVTASPFAPQKRSTALPAPSVGLSAEVAAKPSPNALPKQTETSLTTRELIDQIRGIDWFQFEQLVALVYRKQGYAVSRRGGANPDGGIDLVIERDAAHIAVQCKHWKTRDVGVKAVREFLGALTDSGIPHGMFITLGGYTGDAKRLADKHGIEVLNETGLAGQLDATDARFDPAVLEILRDKRKLCPKCEREMVLRTAGTGLGAGKQFWGCSGFPRCRFTMPLAG
jgi:restriction system protein